MSRKSKKKDKKSPMKKEDTNTSSISNVFNYEETPQNTSMQVLMQPSNRLTSTQEERKTEKSQFDMNSDSGSRSSQLDMKSFF